MKLHSRLEDILGTHAWWRKNVAPKPVTLFPLSSRVSVLLPRVGWAVAASSHRRWAGEPQDMGSPHQMLLEHQLWGRSLWEWSLPEPGPGRERRQLRGAAESRCSPTLGTAPCRAPDVMVKPSPTAKAGRQSHQLFMTNGCPIASLLNNPYWFASHLDTHVLQMSELPRVKPS